MDALVQEALGVFPWLRLTRDIHLRRIDRTFDIGEFETVSEEHKKELRAWFEKHGCVVMDSSIHSHVSWRPYSKAEGVQHLLTTCSSLDTDTVKENFIFIGDNLNDEPAFEYFTHSVGVQNITPILPKLSSRPRFITQASYGQGFVEVVEYILSHRS